MNHAAKTDVTFGLIGPLYVRCAGHPVAVPAARQRNLLAALLLRANQPVAKHDLCEVVWTEPIPDQAETTLRSYVMRLRRVLGPALGGRLILQPPGYLLRLDRDDELDLLRFQACIGRGKSAALKGDWDASMREFSAGLALWRGEPLCDVPSDALHHSVLPVLLERRTQVWEGLFAAAQHLGRAAEFVVPLQRLTEESPLSERFSAMLMSALALSNRRVDALAEFRRLRQYLIAEQGVEPGKVARDLHQRLLSDQDAPTTPPPRTGQISVSPARIGHLVPRQLPRGAATFIGRAAELAELAGLVSASPDGHAAPPVVAITGFPGIGKSELAVQVARRVADHYPDGQLYADLGGSRASPVSPRELAGRFLRALGVDPHAVAPDEAEAVAQYRSVLASRRILIVLDDALDAEQLRPLVPGSGSCGVLVTARSCQPLLAEARSLVLAELTSADSRDLVRAIIGHQRALAEPTAVSSVVASCAGIPLALRVAGAKLAARPGWPVRHLATLLANDASRLDELSYGGASVRAGLESAFAGLISHGPGTLASVALVTLGRWPSNSITAAEAAVLTGQSPAEAIRALEALVDAGLALSAGPGEYRLYELMRLYAAERADAVLAWGGDSPGPPGRPGSDAAIELTAQRGRHAREAALPAPASRADWLRR